MDIYTTLTQQKQAMNDGTTPPMTPVPEDVHHIIDPAFTIGMGALMEDEEKGLRCPVRGCGEWRHDLRMHILGKHPDIGPDGVRGALSIPRTAALISSTRRAALVERARTVFHADRATLSARLDRAHATKRRPAARRPSARENVGMRNLVGRCDAQVSHKLIDLQNKLGRRPTIREATTELGSGFVAFVCRVYGSWNATLARCGADRLDRSNAPKRRCRWDETAALESLRAYHAVHGRMPSVNQANRPTRFPLIPTADTMKRALGEPTWYDCMRKAARILGIRDGRYGLMPFTDEDKGAA